jgi:hypothetical protein
MRLLDNHNALGVLILILASVLTYLGKISGTEWASTVAIIFGTLVSGNAVMHTATQITGRSAIQPVDKSVPKPS